MPFIAHGDWEHLLLTHRRNLRNEPTTFAFGFAARNVPDPSVATWGVLEHLKRELGPRGGFLHPILKYNSFMDQNGDAANRLFNERTIGALEEKILDGDVREGRATLLYLKMINQMLAPIEDPNFGDPLKSTESMWKGLYTLRLWRDYVRLQGSLERHFTSNESYRTCEVIVHGCTNHFLTGKLAGGNLDWQRLGPTRNVADDRPLEGRFGLLRSGKVGSNMSVNKSIAQIAEQLALSEGSQAAKVRMAELGVPVPRPKGKKDTWKYKTATAEAYATFDERANNLTYAEFKEEIAKAKKRGLLAAQAQIRDLAPKMAGYLETNHRGIWDQPMPNVGSDWRQSLGPSASATLVSGLDPDLAQLKLPMTPAEFARTHIDGSTATRTRCASGGEQASSGPGRRASRRSTERMACVPSAHRHDW